MHFLDFSINNANVFIIKNQTELHMEVGWEYRKLLLNVEWE